MTTPSPSDTAGDAPLPSAAQETPADARQERLAKALRRNLQRRKQANPA